jgi:NCAIR mutase (PurE)-related protein
MHEPALRELLAAIAAGRASVDEAVARLRNMPFEDLGFAKIDHHRGVRCGFPEVIFCQGKTTAQVAAIFDRCAVAGGNVLATRAESAVYEAVRRAHPAAAYCEAGRTIVLRQQPCEAVSGTVAVIAAGTSDIPVAEEARVTAEIMDAKVVALHDVGVAGLHRLLAQAELLQSADVIVAVAGMEGALPSVIGGLVACPVIAVPTSVGYGAHFAGLSTLLAMLNSCAAGVTVVNIDNGFGAGYAAARILRGRAAEPKPG